MEMLFIFSYSFFVPTVPPREIDIPDTENSGSSSQAVAVLLVSALVLLTVALPCLIWSLVTTTGGGN